MKYINLLSLFLLVANMVFAGGTAPRTSDELWLVIVPVAIVLLMLLSTYLNKTIRRKIEEKRLRKEEELLRQLEEQNMPILNVQF